MSLKLRDTNNKFIMDFEETSKSITVTEFEPTTFNMKDGEYNFEPVETYQYSFNSLNGQPIHGSWYDTTNQTAPVSGTATAMLCNSGSGNGITKVSNKQFKVQYGGVYNLQFSVQLDHSSGSGEHIFIWFRKNGVDIPYSASEVAIQGSLAEAIPSWNFIFDLEIDDYVEVMYSVTDTDVYLKAVAPNSRPGIPSVIITMWKL
jgi:hypothetical protein